VDIGEAYVNTALGVSNVTYDCDLTSVWNVFHPLGYSGAISPALFGAKVRN
jgi:hypothetical protein